MVIIYFVNFSFKINIKIFPMKYYCLFLLLLIYQASVSQVNYEEHFTQNALRIDFLLAGGSQNEEIYLQNFTQEHPWAGTRQYLTTPFEYGNYAVTLENPDNELIYFRGFSTLFEEWVTTEQAKDRQKAFQQTIRVPFPKHKVILKIKKRIYKTGKFQTIAEREISPDNYFIRAEDPPDINFTRILKNGTPASKVDLVFISEGYRKEDMKKYRKDVQEITDYIFSQKPFDQHQKSFNVYAVESISRDAGPDIPGENTYKNTAINSSFYTFDTPRYLTSTSTWKIRDIASVVPYDHIIILVNTDRYGGGGFYNHFTASTSDHFLSNKVIIHELGHGFAGLGDEYYTSDVAYSEFYNLNIEPWEPNITTRTNFKTKWKNMMKEETPVPTPREPEYTNTIGVFEGGGYLTKGIYSPYMDCRMKSNASDGFCPVCQKAIERMIFYYTGELK